MKTAPVTILYIPETRWKVLPWKWAGESSENGGYWGDWSQMTALKNEGKIENCYYNMYEENNWCRREWLKGIFDSD